MYCHFLLFWAQGPRQIEPVGPRRIQISRPNNSQAQPTAEPNGAGPGLHGFLPRPSMQLSSSHAYCFRLPGQPMLPPPSRTHARPSKDPLLYDSTSPAWSNGWLSFSPRERPDCQLSLSHLRTAKHQAGQLTAITSWLAHASSSLTPAT